MSEAAPDAVTELAQAKADLITLDELVDMAETHALCTDRLAIEVEKVEQLRAERDAALAAIERVRAVCDDAERIKVRNREWRKLSGRASTSTHDPIPGLKEVLAALDGAPEPEWEYSVGFNDPECGWINDHADIHDNYEDARSDYSEPHWLVEDRVVRRRPAGPWLPVEGES